MTREEIIRMAREAGFETIDGKLFLVGYDGEFSVEFLERFAAIVAAHEREACAKVCEDDMGWLDNGGGELCAKAIRARGEK